jgi:hypothetical protein
MRARSILGVISTVCLLFGVVCVVPGLAQEREAVESGAKEPSAATALSTEDLNGPLTPADLVNALVGDGISISNVTYTGSTFSAGTFSGGTGIVGFESGIILSTGSIANVIGPNISDGITWVSTWPGDDDLTNLSGFPTQDAAVLEFDFVPAGNAVTFRYVFASDEYNEYVHTQYNDVFAFFVNGVNCATIGGDPVSINTINNGNPYDSVPRENPDYYINNDLSDGGGAIDTEMDGLTVVMVCDANVTADATNHMKLAIADASDALLDANVFLEEGSFVVPEPEPEPPPPPPAEAPFVPEASTLLLLGSGATGLAGYVGLQWRARRRK